MSIYVMSRVWKHSKQDGGALLVLLAMADYANDEGMCWPSMANLGKKARLSERQVQRIVRDLVNDGELDFIKGSSGAMGDTNLYRVITEGGRVTSAPLVTGDIFSTEMSPDPSRDPSLDIKGESDGGDITPENIYLAYPRHIGKPAALKAIKAAMRRGTKPARLFAMTKSYAELCALEKQDPAYIPYPATWFNQDRFNDDPATWSKVTRGKPMAPAKPAADYSNGGGFGETRHHGE